MEQKKTNQSKQLCFDFLDQQHGIVYKLHDGTWQAEIGGGWWIARGSTKDAAIKSVTARYYNETEK